MWRLLHYHFQTSFSGAIKPCAVEVMSFVPCPGPGGDTVNETCSMVSRCILTRLCAICGQVSPSWWKSFNTPHLELTSPRGNKMDVLWIVFFFLGRSLQEMRAKLQWLTRPTWPTSAICETKRQKRRLKKFLRQRNSHGRCHTGARNSVQKCFGCITYLKLVLCYLSIT